MRKTRILVTGGAGFIGSAFAREQLENALADRLVVVDALTYAGTRERLNNIANPDALRFVHGDCSDQSLLDSLLINEQIDIVVHFAAHTHVDRSISAPDDFIHSNIHGTYGVLESLRRYHETHQRWIRLHHISTDEVYGSLPDSAATPDFPYRPSSPYSATKAGSDHLVHAYTQTFGLPATISHCTNNYGPFQHPEKLIPHVISCLLSGQSIPVYGDGLQQRDWLHVADHVEALSMIVHHNPDEAVHHISAQTSRNNIDVIRLICDLLDEYPDKDFLTIHHPRSYPAIGRSCHEAITFVKDRPGHDRRYALMPTQELESWGFRCRIPLEAGLRDTLNWYIQNGIWWKTVMDNSRSESITNKPNS